MLKFYENTRANRNGVQIKENAEAIPAARKVESLLRYQNFSPQPIQKHPAILRSCFRLGMSVVWTAELLISVTVAKQTFKLLAFEVPELFKKNQLHTKRSLGGVDFDASY